MKRMVCKILKAIEDNFHQFLREVININGSTTIVKQMDESKLPSGMEQILQRLPNDRANAVTFSKISHILEQVVMNPVIKRVLKVFQAGESFHLYRDGDCACSMGHFDLLFQKRQKRIPVKLGYRSLEHAAESGNLKLVEWVMAEMPELVQVSDEVLREFPSMQKEKVWDAIDKSAEMGHFHVLEWLVGRYPEQLSRKPLNYACRLGHWAMLEYLYPLKSPEAWGGDPTAIEYAATGGHLRVLEWLHSAFPCFRPDHPAYCLPNAAAMDWAAHWGHLQVVEWLHNQYGAIGSMSAMTWAAREGHMPIVEWCYAHLPRRLLCTRDAINWASRHGRLEVVEWLHIHQTDGQDHSDNPHMRTEGVSKEAMDWGAMGGHLPVVTFLHYNRSEGCSQQAWDQAAMHGHLATLEFLHHHRTEGATKDALSWAAMQGHIEVVKWLHKNREDGATVMALNGAAKNGHLAVVEWLHWNRDDGATVNAMNWAAKEGHLAVVEFLHKYRLEGCTHEAMDQAAGGGHLEVVEFLHNKRQECCSEFAMNNAATHGRLEVLKWLSKQRNEGCTVHAMDAAAANGFLDVCEWLFNNGHNHGVSKKGYGGAIRSGYANVVSWLKKHFQQEMFKNNVPYLIRPKRVTGTF
eukprot:CAMPEP_0117742392 /NCGR_PEP_ID=MMETSP0947-20121206/5520_1 /TAXON_ID=44440 /ORGANISM="Chattonella subsalsa, Strain CCMP2191" /LENGTH=632 /DNA_ID=CAMNT_0005558909 /DNA_START=26 /DNA_END=1925 /DNA_ORIENTATION=+